MDITFLGATGTVTGSKYLLEGAAGRVLVDCGLFQGIKNDRLKNWKQLPFDVSTIDAVVLTHAHIDHSGYIPALVKQGFKGKVYASEATVALCHVLLPDSGHLQEEDARYANKRRFSKHQPAEPLYTEKDALKALKQFETVSFDKPKEILPSLSVTFRPAGHILGASSIKVSSEGKNVVFSGDLGRDDDAIMYPPEPLDQCDYLIVESTYGDRLHHEEDVESALAEIINKTVKRGGTVLLPAFAVGRAQMLLYYVQKLIDEARIPTLPVYLNSPMAITATELFCRFNRLHRLSASDCAKIDKAVTYVRTQQESIDLNANHYPSVIISASGMASGGRVLHHLKSLLPSDRNSVVFAGYQAAGTRGQKLCNGAQEVKIHGQNIPVNADVHSIDSLSAHGDYKDIINWLKTCPEPPKRVFVTHGEPASSDSMRCHINSMAGWSAEVPEYMDKIELI
jgi:metallo-beta-lactamase family protein